MSLFHHLKKSGAPQADTPPRAAEVLDADFLEAMSGEIDALKGDALKLLLRRRELLQLRDNLKNQYRTTP